LAWLAVTEDKRAKLSYGVFENGFSSKSAVMGFGFITITRDWQLFVVFVKETPLLTFSFFCSLLLPSG
jgi:hypothetical protein